MRNLVILAGFAITFLFIHGVSAQQPTPAMLVVQAATASRAPVSPTAKSIAPESSASLQAAIKALQEAKAANAETLKRQEATLQQLDDLQKAAEQLKIFAKRG
jgi:hypothetical protein